MKHPPSHPSLAITIAQSALAKKHDKEQADEGDGRLEAMQAFLAAVKDGNAEEALSEFENLMTMCGE